MGRLDLRRSLITAQNRESLANPKTTIAMEACKFRPKPPIALSGPGTFTVVQRDSPVPGVFLLSSSVGSVLLFFLPRHRDVRFCSTSIWKTTDYAASYATSYGGAALTEQSVCARGLCTRRYARWAGGLALINTEDRETRGGATCVALLRKPNEDKQALAARMGGIDHCRLSFPMRRCAILVPVLNAQLGVPR